MQQALNDFGVAYEGNLTLFDNDK
ncbi:Protein of unknown function [Weissella confusa LBAE C39-2]|nr:Protein of unknown function [Weissella confusa LBAE C39-2]